MKTSIIILATLVLMAAIYLYREQNMAIVQAVAENHCETFGAVGTIHIARCVDPDTYEVIYANSAGYLEREK